MTVNSKVPRRPSRGLTVYRERARRARRILHLNFFAMAPTQQLGPNLHGARGNTAKQVSENKTTQVLQSAYVLNKSGTKRVTLGLEPALDFEPVVHLHKPGYDGMRMSRGVWEELLKASTHISSYFKNEVRNDQKEIMLSHVDKVQFRQQYGRNLISISTMLDEKKEVVLAEATWYRLMELQPLIAHSLAIMTTWQSEALEMFTSFARALKARLPTHGPAAHHPDFVEFFQPPARLNLNVLRSLALNNLDFGPQKLYGLDYNKCFFEMQAFLADEIVGYIAFV